MEEKIGIIKWLTSLSDRKRNTAGSLLIISILISGIYGMGKYIESSMERDRKKCLDDNTRITVERDSFQKKLETANRKHLEYVEERNKRYEELYIKTQQLEQIKK